MDDASITVAWNPQNITSNETRVFSKVLNITIKYLVPQIVNSKVKFGTTVANITSSEKLYTLGQCTLDLSASDCDRLTGAWRLQLISFQWCLEEGFCYQAAI